MLILWDAGNFPILPTITVYKSKPQQALALLPLSDRWYANLSFASTETMMNIYVESSSLLRDK